MRKNFLLLSTLIFLFSCTPDGKTPSTNASTTSAVAPVEEYGAVGPRTTEPEHVPASILAPMIGMWHYSTVAGIKDAKSRDDYMGRWIDLKGDQSFTSGIWEEQTNSGKWTFEGESGLINFFYTQSEGIYDEFRVQGVGRDIVVFKGNTGRTSRGIQIKMIKENGRPVQ